MGKFQASEGGTRKKNKMPAFLAKAKKNPGSTNPASKNKKGFSKSKGRSAKEQDSDAGRSGADQAPVSAPSNRADYALEQLRKPKADRNKKLA